MQRGGIKATRDESICRVLASINFRVEDWIGTVTKIDSNSDGKGVVSISISEHITLEIWNNELSDIRYNTPIQPGTALFEAAKFLKPSEQVSFSGTFFMDREYCVKEGSLTLRGKLDDPEFIFKFINVAPYSTTARADPAPIQVEGAKSYSLSPDTRAKPSDTLRPETEPLPLTSGSSNRLHADERFREEIWSAVQTWNSSIMVGDIGRFKGSYDNSLTRFYGQTNVSVDSAVKMITAEIKKYQVREVAISNPSFQRVGEDGVQVDYDKEYRFAGEGVQVNQGKVRASLRLRRTETSEWRITAEFDRETCRSTLMRDSALRSPPGMCP